MKQPERVWRTGEGRLANIVAFHIVKSAQCPLNGTRNQQSMIRRFLPGFKACCLTVGFLYVLMAGSLFLKGLMTSMTAFQVPVQTTNSPHYHDAILWVYSHMIVLGLLIGVVGCYATDRQLQKWVARLLLIVHVYYTYLDFRTSDSFLGNGLYKGAGSVIPGFVCLFVTLLFAQLVLFGEPFRPKSVSNPLQTT